VLHEAQRYLTQVSSDPELADLYRRGGADRCSLSDAERDRFDRLVMAGMRNGESLFIQSRRGILTDADWEGLRETIRLFLQRSGIKEWIKERQGELNRNFVKFLDGLNEPRGSSAT
jgi:hypothetical protein